MRSLSMTITMITILALTGAPAAPGAGVASSKPVPHAAVAATEQAPYGASVQAVSVSNKPDVYGMTMATGGGAGQDVLVIPAGDIEPEDIARINEDMSVMSYILEKKLDESGPGRAPLRELGLLLRDDSARMRAVYLDGYGALFMMETDVMLSPGAESQEPKKAASSEQADETWLQARQELFEPQQYFEPRGQGDPPRYSALEVENLKAGLIKSLKHAANIRNLKADEQVILSVVGAKNAQNMFVQYRMMHNAISGSSNSRSSGFSGGAVGGGGFGGGAIGGAGIGGAGGTRAKTMTIRAKKSDVDAFAADKLDFDKFREKVMVLIY